MDKWNAAGLGELPTEWTWDEYMAACKAMTEVDEKGEVVVYGGSDFHSTNYWTYPGVQVDGANPYYNADGTAQFDDPVNVAALKREYQAEVVDKIWFPKTRYNADNIRAYATFCNGNVASTIITNVELYLHRTDLYPNVDWVTGFAPYPVNEKGQTNYMSGVAPFSHVGISANCQDETAAWLFLKWFATYGIKYHLTSGHRPSWTGTPAGLAYDMLYGENGAEVAPKYLDTESFERVCGNTALPAFIEDEMTGYSAMGSLITEYTMMALSGEMSVEDAIAALDKEAEQAILDAK